MMRGVRYSEGMNACTATRLGNKLDQNHVLKAHVVNVPQRMRSPEYDIAPFVNFAIMYCGVHTDRPDELIEVVLPLLTLFENMKAKEEFNFAIWKDKNDGEVYLAFNPRGMRNVSLLSILVIALAWYAAFITGDNSTMKMCMTSFRELWKQLKALEEIQTHFANGDMESVMYKIHAYFPWLLDEMRGIKTIDALPDGTILNGFSSN